MKYRTTNYDLIAIEVRKGKRDAYKMVAAELGISLSGLIQNAVEEYIQNHADELVDIERSVIAEESFTEAELRLSENFSKLPKRVQQKFAGLIQEFAKRTAPKKKNYVI